MKRIRTLISFCYVSVDLVLLAVVFFVPYFSYYDYRHPVLEFKMHMLLYAFWTTMTILLFSSSQLYQTIRDLTVFREVRRTVRAFVFSTLLATLLLFFLKIQTFSRLVLAQNVCFALVTLTFWRVVKRVFVQYLVARGFNNVNVLVVGGGRVGKRLSEILHSHPQMGLK